MCCPEGVNSSETAVGISELLCYTLRKCLLYKWNETNNHNLVGLKAERLEHFAHFAMTATVHLPMDNWLFCGQRPNVSTTVTLT